VVVAGNSHAFYEELHEAVVRHWPIIVLKDSGGHADLLVSAVEAGQSDDQRLQVRAKWIGDGSSILRVVCLLCIVQPILALMNPFRRLLWMANGW
jgi:hypothetical protein